MYDGFVVAVVVGVYLFSKRPTESKSLKYFATIVLCVKAAYFFDREKSLNFVQSEMLAGWKNFLQKDERVQPVVVFGGLISMVAIEVLVVNPKFNLNQTVGSAFFSNGLSGLLFVQGALGLMLNQKSSWGSGLALGTIQEYHT